LLKRPTAQRRLPPVSRRQVCRAALYCALQLTCTLPPLRLPQGQGAAAVADIGGSIITGIDGNPLAVLCKQMRCHLADIRSGELGRGGSACRGLPTHRRVRTPASSPPIHTFYGVPGGGGAPTAALPHSSQQDCTLTLSPLRPFLPPQTPPSSIPTAASPPRRWTRRWRRCTTTCWTSAHC
jgi:hypothetical protein